MGVPIKKVDIANQMGISRQNFTNKLARDTFSPEELSKLFQILGYDLIIKNGKTEYKIKY